MEMDIIPLQKAIFELLCEFDDLCKKTPVWNVILVLFEHGIPSTNPSTTLPGPGHLRPR